MNMLKGAVMCAVVMTMVYAGYSLILEIAKLTPLIRLGLSILFGIGTVLFTWQYEEGRIN